MKPESVEALFFLRLTTADIRWTDARAASFRGGGQTYFDVPTTVKAQFEAFSGVDPDENWVGEVLPIGQGAKTDLAIDSRGERNTTRRKVADQRANRHPAWTVENGFPVLDSQVPDFDFARDSEAAAESIREAGLTVFLARTRSGDHYAGFVTGTELPQGWPASLAPLFDSSQRGGTLNFELPMELSPLARAILAALKRKRNVLLVGPPATGKTRAVKEVWEYLDDPVGSAGVRLRPDSPESPFAAGDAPAILPPVVAKEWMTFHQSVSYEEFIVGLRPVAAEEGPGFSVMPRAGRLLKLAIQVCDAEIAAPNESLAGLMVIDEINRGNAARAFGEFITFMDPEYRTSHCSADPPSGLPVPLPTVSDDGELTEAIGMAGGGVVQLPVPWHFPPWVLMIATMNSVDRATAPLDSALARRFEQIFVPPDLDDLAGALDVDVDALLERTQEIGSEAESGEEPGEFSPAELAYLLLRRLNDELASDFGPDLELGQGLLYGVGEAADPLQRLAQIWDFELLPQLIERYEARPERLGQLLRLEEGLPESSFVYQPRTDIFGNGLEGTVAADWKLLSEVYDNDPALVRRTLERVAVPTIH